MSYFYQKFRLPDDDETIKVFGKGCLSLTIIAFVACLILSIFFKSKVGEGLLFLSPLIGIITGVEAYIIFKKVSDNEGRSGKNE